MIAAGSEEGFRLEASVPSLNLNNLLASGKDIALFVLILCILGACILVLAYWCYRPIRALVRRYAGDHGGRSNELIALDKTLEQLQSRTAALNSQARSRTALLRNYLLLMLLNNFRTTSMVEDLEQIGIRFEHRMFL